MDIISKKLLITDLSARLPYDVKGKVYAEVSDEKYDISGDMIFYDAPFDVILDGINVSTEEIHVVAIGNEDTVDFIEMQQTDGKPYTIDEFKPYLRPMSSMTEEEKKELKELHFYYADAHIVNDEDKDFKPIIVDEVHCSCIIDWLNKHHFDYRGLIEKGLVLPAPEGMYKKS